MTRWLALLPLAFGGLIALLLVSRVHHDPHYTPAALVGRPMPDESLTPLDGGAPVRLSRQVAPATVINFFASWCAPCQEEQPVLLALKAQGVRVIGIVSPWRYDPQAIRSMLAAGDPYAETLIDRDGRAVLDFGVSGVPETFVIGKDGRVVAKYALPLTPQTAEALLEKSDTTH